MQKRVVGVKFQESGRMYYFDALALDIQAGTDVIVQTSSGEDYGRVVMGPKMISTEDFKEEIFPVIRVASPEDTQKNTELKASVGEAFEVFERCAAQHDLNMKLIDVSPTFDGRKIIFFYTADGRVDFRDLVRDLASHFKSRIELRQIGVRDEARKYGSIGICGRKCCCANWINDIVPVTIQMAKDQNLSLNATKISGVCGKLLCCLKFEHDYYKELSKKMPKIGSKIKTPMGKGTVFKLRTLEETVLVKLINDKDEVEIKSFSLEELEKAKNEPEVKEERKPSFPGISDEAQSIASSINKSFQERTSKKPPKAPKKSKAKTKQRKNRPKTSSRKQKKKKYQRNAKG